MNLELNQLYNMDCMEGMKELPDNYFELAIVDPPYFKGPEKRMFFGRKTSPIGVHRTYAKLNNWEIPDKMYFDELLRVSKNQIIWGVNYFDYAFGSGRIIWDKCNGKNSFSDAEIAYCSMHDSVRLFRYLWNGMFQGKSIQEGHVQQGNKVLNEKRIHPTQKPVILYKWLLTNYAKQGDKILDTHAGSASLPVACYDQDFEFMAFEKDKTCFDLANKRLEEVRAQIRLF